MRESSRCRARQAATARAACATVGYDAGITQPVRERRRQITQIDGLPRNAMLPGLNECGRAIRAKTDPYHRDRPGRPQHQRRCQLPRENRPRLAPDRAILVDHLERVAEMHDDLGPAIGQDRLRGRRQIVDLLFQGPDAANDAREGRRGRVFGVAHDAATLV
jgi:hypothetical protein